MTTTPVKWGLISTADINRKVIPGAQESPKVDLVGAEYLPQLLQARGYELSRVRP